MSSVRLAFYKATKQSWTDMVISGWTFLFNPFTKSYSHVEIGFNINGTWQYFSSSIRDGGTRWKNAKDLLKNPERWDIYTSEYRQETIDRMIKRAENIKGKSYDRLGILGFVTLSGQVFNDKDKWYCSETCYFVLTALWKKRISPRRLSRRIKGHFHLIPSE